MMDKEKIEEIKAAVDTPEKCEDLAKQHSVYLERMTSRGYNVISVIMPCCDTPQLMLQHFSGPHLMACPHCERLVSRTGERSFHSKGYKNINPRAPSAMFQPLVADWMLVCFGPTISADKVERAQRFLEEAIELAQALHMPREDAHKLVDYVFNRPIGEVDQEVGGVMVTLAALANASRTSINRCAMEELDRINDPVVTKKIRDKQATKPKGSPLPETPKE